MIRTIIIDDEVSAINVISLILQASFSDKVQIIATSNSPFEGKKLIERLSPDLVFLDIQMPGMNGIDLVRSFQDPAFRVVFVTAYDAYAIEAFKLSAIDYLLKPVDESEIERVINRIEKDMHAHVAHKNNFPNNINHFDEFLHNNIPKEARIGISMADKIIFVNPGDILYCEAKGTYTNLYFHGGNKMVASRPLCDFEFQLSGHGFFRIHNSTLINLRYVKEFQRHYGGFVILDNGVKLEVSQRRRKSFLAAIQNIIV